MTELNADTVLQLAPSLTIESGESTTIRVGDKTITATPNVFSILEVFADPTKYGEGVKRLSSRVAGGQGWIELVSNIRALHDAGVLVGESETRQSALGYAAPQIHIAMLNDTARTNAFISAIRKTVTADDVVVDVGTGTGVLAVAAAQAGARHVYAIEASKMAELASEVFAANGLADRITLIRGNSLNVELPEKATVLVAELIGNDALDERVLEIFADARERFLTPGARIIPQRAKVFGVPVTIDRDSLQGNAFTRENLASWKKLYGIDFSPLSSLTVKRAIVLSRLPQEIKDWTRLARPVMLADIELSGTLAPMVQQSVETTIDKNGEMDGVVTYFELDVHGGERITTSPEDATATNHWTVPIWLLKEPRAVTVGERFNISYRYRVDSTGPRVEIEPA